MSTRTAAWIAWPLSGLSAVLGGLYLLLLVLYRANPEVNIDPYWGAGTVVAVVFPAVGALIVTRYPGNALGWVFCAVGLSGGVGEFAGGYAACARFIEPGSLPGGVAATWIARWAGNAGETMQPAPLLVAAAR